MSQALALRPKETAYMIPQELKDIYLNTVFSGLTENEAQIAYRIARKRNLDVEARQIFFVVYESKGKRTVVSQTSIDGFRLIASKTGKYGGSVSPKLTIKDKSGNKLIISHEEYDPDETDHIISGTISVINTDFPQPQTATALFDSYCKKYNGIPTGLWATMPDVMILKCAEALALRKAFPQDLSGIYTSDEMDQAQNDNSVESISVQQIQPKKQPSLKAFKPKLPAATKQPDTTEQDVHEAAEETVAEEVVEEKIPAKKQAAKKPQTVVELINFIPDGLVQMKPDIDPDVFDAAKYYVISHFGAERAEDIADEKLEEVRDFVRNDMIQMLKEYGYLE